MSTFTMSPISTLNTNRQNKAQNCRLKVIPEIQTGEALLYDDGAGVMTRKFRQQLLARLREESLETIASMQVDWHSRISRIKGLTWQAN